MPGLPAAFSEATQGKTLKPEQSDKLCRPCIAW
jgi:hypothetical protein